MRGIAPRFEATAETTHRNGDGLLIGAYDDRVWRIIFLPANVPAFN